MKSAGHTFDEIAEKLKFADRSGAHKACKRAMEYVEVHLGETLAEVLAQQLAAYRRVAAHLNPMVMSKSPIIGIVKQWIGVMTRIDRLSGLDHQTTIQASDAMRIIESLAQAGDREALREIANGSDPVQVAIARLKGAQAPAQPGSVATH